MNLIYHPAGVTKESEPIWRHRPSETNVTASLISHLESMSGFHADRSPQAAWDYPCDWGVRVIRGAFEGRPAFKIFSTKDVPIYALVVDAGKTRYWDSARHLSADLSPRMRWKLPSAIEIVHMSNYGILPKFDFLPDVEFGLLWSRAETAEEDKQIFKGTSNFVSVNLKTLGRRTVSLEQQIERHRELLQEMEQDGVLDAHSISEADRLRKVLARLEDGVPVYCVTGALHPFFRTPLRR